jgi:integrase
MIRLSRQAAAAGPHALYVLFLAYTGLRWGEFAALRVKHVDLLRRRITVAESASDIGGVMVFGPTKNHSRWRGAA